MGAVLNALERLSNGYSLECERLRKDITIAEAQLRDYQANLGKPFTLDAYLSELTAVHASHKSGSESGPSSS